MCNLDEWPSPSANVNSGSDRAGQIADPAHQERSCDCTHQRVPGLSQHRRYLAPATLSPLGFYSITDSLTVSTRCWTILNHQGVLALSGGVFGAFLARLSSH